MNTNRPSIDSNEVPLTWRQARAARINELLPLISKTRYASDRETRRVGVLLQAVLLDLERLNSIELYCEENRVPPQILQLLRRP
jgi:hypothetical protein